MKNTPAGRGWAYVAIGVGAGVSVAANVAHALLPPEHASATWTPERGAVIFSVFWPVALFFAVEVLVRIKWPRGWGWKVTRFGGLLPVAVVAAAVSYQHLHGLLLHYGEHSLTALIGPLAVDGLMVMATGALLATKATYQQQQALVGQPAAAIAAPRALAASAVSTATTEPDTPISETRGEPPSGRGAADPFNEKGDNAEAVARLRSGYPEWTQKQVAARLGISVRTVRRYWKPATA